MIRMKIEFAHEPISYIEINDKYFNKCLISNRELKELDRIKCEELIFKKSCWK